MNRKMTEDLLHFIWKLRLFNPLNLKTVDGEPLSILKVGYHNADAGPDFLFAHIRIDGQDWFGNVELHVRSSEWEIHRHQYDAVYNNVILHVVWKYNRPSYRADGTCIPTFVLSDLVQPILLQKYNYMMAQERWIACQAHLDDVDPFKKAAWLDSMTIARLELKAHDIFTLLDRFDNNWEQVFFIWLCRSMGFKVNAAPFQELGESLSVALLRKYRDEVVKVEALCFGVGNLLSGNENDDFPRILSEEFAYLSDIHQLKKIQASWRLLRMRPYNFPYIRMAQLISLLTEKQLSLSSILALSSLKEARDLFSDLKINPYWLQHFSFDKPTRQHYSGQFGKDAINVLILNAVIVPLFSYGKYFKIESHMEKAFGFLTALPPESNHIVSGFAQAGWPAANASDSQAMIQLKHDYCDQKQCLKCRVGAEILRS